jgi:hypothetical protein
MNPEETHLNEGDLKYMREMIESENLDNKRLF